MRDSERRRATPPHWQHTQAGERHICAPRRLLRTPTSKARLAIRVLCPSGHLAAPTRRSSHTHNAGDYMGTLRMAANAQRPRTSLLFLPRGTAPPSYGAGSLQPAGHATHPNNEFTQLIPSNSQRSRRVAADRVTRDTKSDSMLVHLSRSSATSIQLSCAPDKASA